MQTAWLIIGAFMFQACSGAGFGSRFDKSDTDGTESRATSDDSEKPGDDTEGVPGYLKEPKQVVFDLQETDSGIAFTIKGAAESVGLREGVKGSLTDVKAYAWQISPSELERIRNEGRGLEEKQIVVTGLHLVTVDIEEDGSFQIDGEAPNKNPIVLSVIPPATKSTLTIMSNNPSAPDSLAWVEETQELLIASGDPSSNVPTPAGNRYFVAPGGNDSQAGTEAKPFGTIVHGLSLLKPGDALYLDQGTYVENVVNVPGGTSWDKPILIAAKDGAKPIIKPDGGENVVRLDKSTQQYIILDGLVLDGTNITASSIHIGGDVDSGEHAHHIKLINSELTNSPQQAVYITNGARDNELKRLKIHKNGANDKPAVVLKGTRDVIASCEIYDNFAEAIMIYGDTVVPAEIAIDSNKIYDNGASGGNGVGIVLGAGSGHSVYNNVIFGNVIGINVLQSGSDIFNNTVYGQSSYGIHFLATVTNVSLSNNLSVSNQVLDISIAEGAGVTDKANQTDDPGFVNAAGGDFRLKPDSPAIDSGIAIETLGRDFLRAPRPRGAAIDVGAYEFYP